VLAGPRSLEAAGWYALERAARCDETLLISNLQTLLRLAVRHDTEPDAPDAEHAEELGDEDGDPWQIDRASILGWVTAGWRIADRLRQGAEPAEAVRGEPVGRPEFHRAFERVDVDAAVVDAPLV
jgi:hypothetical protein